MQTRDVRCSVVSCRSVRHITHVGGLPICWVCIGVSNLFKQLAVCACGRPKPIGMLYCPRCLRRD